MMQRSNINKTRMTMQLARIACLLHSSAFSSCTCCIDPIKFQVAIARSVVSRLPLLGSLEHAVAMAFEINKSPDSEQNRLFNITLTNYCHAVPVLHFPALALVFD